MMTCDQPMERASREQRREVQWQKLYELLRHNGVDAHMDTIASQDRQDWTHQQISMANHVLIVISSEYKRQFEGTAAPGIGRGLRHEGLVVGG